MTFTGTVTQNAEGAVQWKVEGFRSLEMDAVYFSPDFSCAGGKWNLWIRRVHPEGGRSGQRIQLQLWRCPIGPCILEVEYTFSVQSRDGHRHGERRNRTEFVYVSLFGRGTFSPFIVFDLEEERMSDLVPGDTLTILCRLALTGGAGVSARSNCSYCGGLFDAGSISSHQGKCLDKPIRCPECSEVVVLRNWYDHQCHSRSSAQAEASTSRSTLPKMRILRDFKEMFVKQEDCDVIIRVKEEEFRAHSNILKARSPVLASMLCSDMREKSTGIIQIDDVDPSVFSKFLCFLYCAEVDSLSIENVFELYTASDKYDLPELRSECAEFMNRTLSNDTFCDVFRLAVLHSDTLLTDVCTDYFLQNASSIVETDAWTAFSDENPKKSNELFTKFVLGKKDKSFKRIKLSDE